jgi:hypothetical protein
VSFATCGDKLLIETEGVSSDSDKESSLEVIFFGLFVIAVRGYEGSKASILLVKGWFFGLADGQSE